MKYKLSTLFLIAAALFLGMNIGAGIHQHLFAIPEMFRSPEAMRTMYTNDNGQALEFWMPLHGLIFFSLLLSIIFNWRFSERRKLLLFAAGGYIFVSLISIYFASQLNVFKQMTDNSEFYNRTRQWLTLSWFRLLILLISEIMLLNALTKPALKNQA